MKSPEEIRRELAERLVSYGIIIVNEKSIAYGIQWRVQDSHEEAIINTYHGKKGFRLVVQAASPALQQKIEEIYAGLCVADPKSKEKKSSARPNDLATEEPSSYIGCDESGKGDIFGPLVVAAVYFTPAMAEKLQHLHIRDSKTLSDTEIADIATLAKAEFADYIVCQTILPRQYNELYATYQAAGKNLNHLLTDLHAQNIQKLTDRYSPERVILDRFTKEELMQQRLQVLHISSTLLQIPRGERYPGVALASIIARAEFVRAVDSLGATYGEEIPKGAGPATQAWLRGFVERHDRSALPEVGKLHFRTFEMYR